MFTKTQSLYKALSYDMLKTQYVCCFLVIVCYQYYNLMFSIILTMIGFVSNNKQVTVMELCFPVLVRYISTHIQITFLCIYPTTRLPVTDRLGLIIISLDQILTSFVIFASNLNKQN